VSKTLLQKKLEEVLNKLVKYDEMKYKDNKKSNLVCVGKDKNGNKQYTKKSKHNRAYLEHLKKKEEK
tara:strand:+ start:21812 stop:22012 length:201 start_codon:yes stop_codon:yes gene_type:complete